MNNKPIIIALVGESGSGKSSLSFYLRAKHNVPYVCSYTTRPIRPGEVHGRDHWFVDPSWTPAENVTLAFTNFAGHAYWTMPDQIDRHHVVTYVIDERGLIDLRRKWGDKYNVIAVRIVRPDNPTDQARKDRDACRVPFQDWDITIVNDGTLEEFYTNASEKILTYLHYYYFD